MIAHLISYGVGRVANMRRPQALVRALIRGFASFYKIRVDEASRPLDDYRSLDDFFTRVLKPGVRPLGAGLVSPADGKISSCGKIEAGTILQVKGSSYSVDRLVAEPKFTERNAFGGGLYSTIYLAPNNYHRVHAPCEMRIQRVVHVPGALWPVNSLAAKHVRELFAKNERVVIHFQSQGEGVPAARGVVVAVGAFNVGSIDLAFLRLRTNLHPILEPRVPTEYHLGEDVIVSKGAELFTFHLGSTVVLLLDQHFAAASAARPWMVGGASDSGESCSESMVLQGQSLWLSGGSND